MLIILMIQTCTLLYTVRLCIRNVLTWNLSACGILCTKPSVVVCSSVYIYTIQYSQLYYWQFSSNCLILIIKKKKNRVVFLKSARARQSIRWRRPSACRIIYAYVKYNIMTCSLFLFHPHFSHYSADIVITHTLSVSNSATIYTDDDVQ